MNFKFNLFFHLYDTHITPLGVPIPTVQRVSDHPPTTTETQCQQQAGAELCQAQGKLKFVWL